MSPVYAASSRATPRMSSAPSLNLISSYVERLASMSRAKIAEALQSVQPQKGIGPASLQPMLAAINGPAYHSFPCLGVERDSKG